MRKLILGSTALLVVTAFGVGWFLGWFEGASDNPTASGEGGRARLCLHGKFIEPPYDVKYDEDLGEVTINGTSIHRKATTHDVEVTQLHIDMFEVKERIRARYREEIDSEAKHVDAMDACIELAEEEDCVVKVYVDEDDPQVLRVQFEEGPPHGLILRPNAPAPEPTSDELADRRAKNLGDVVDVLRLSLESGGCAFVHSEDLLLCDPPKKGQERMRRVKFELARDVDRATRLGALTSVVNSRAIAEDIVDANKKD